MNMKRKTYLAVSGIGVLALLLTACTSGSNDRGPATADCPDGVVTLSVLRSENNPPTDATLEAYKKVNKCVDFDVTEVPFGQLAEKISVVAPSKNPPDILGYDGPDTQNYASQGVLMSLDEYLPDGWKDDVVPATLAEHSYQGKVYSLGLQQDTLSLFYNKDLTDAAGIEVPATLEDGWTWAEARKAFEQCQQGSGSNVSVYGLAPSRLGNGTPGFAYRDLLFLRSAGDPDAPKDSSSYKTYWALSPDGDEVDGWLNTPEALEAAAWYQQLFTGPNAVTSDTGLPNALLDGKACFDFDNNSLMGKLSDPSVTFNWGVTAAPYFKTPIVHTGSVTIGVMARAAHPVEAAKAVVALSTGQILLDYVTATKRIPVLKSLVAQMPSLNEYPWTIPVGEITQWGQPRPPTPHFTQYNLYVTDALRDIAYGSDVKQALDKAVSQIQPLLGK